VSAKGDGGKEGKGSGLMMQSVGITGRKDGEKDTNVKIIRIRK
jgi:hypothetical protein